jgi:hypothetical protein
VSVTYDAGALVAVDRGDMRMRSRHADLLEAGLIPVVPAPVVWQVWRDGARQARLARVLRGCLIEPVDYSTARAAGELLGRAGAADGVDAVVVISAARRGGLVYTSDPADLRKLSEHLGGRRPSFVIHST